ncbi:hypothetical protein J4Q44_G00051820, partial [Coregonus suidteri]
PSLVPAVQTGLDCQSGPSDCRFGLSVEGERQAGFVLTVDVTGLRLNPSRPVVIKRN